MFVNTRLIQAVLKQAAALNSCSSETDAVLLRTFADTRDEAAFAEIVRRYSRLVWAVCRQLRPNDADAEDAFQATFLVLLRSARSIRTNALGPWLHTVAHRVSCKANRAESRRKSREQLVASSDRDAAVSPSAWDSLTAAVHEEVAKLPEHLRVPFVMCCLEGKGSTEAAKQLGWKLGTLSGRLTRAKQTLLDRLEKRGLPISAMAAGAFTLGTATAVPAAVLAKALDFVQPGTAIPSTILVLAKGTITMSKTKLLAAAVMLTAGLTASIGGWMMSANAQTPDVVKEVKQLAKSLEAKPAPKWEYKYETPAKHIDGFGEYVKDFEKLLEKREQEGWTYLGQANIWFTEKGGVVPRLVFRRLRAVAPDEVLQYLLEEIIVMQLTNDEKADPAKTAAAEAAARAKSFQTLLAQARLELVNQEIVVVRDAILQRMRKDPKETFATALETKLKASPEHKDAVEKYGRVKLEVEVLKSLLAEARQAKLLADKPLSLETRYRTLTEPVDEVAELRKEVEERRKIAKDRKKVIFLNQDFDLPEGALYGIVMKSLDRKYGANKYGFLELTTGTNGLDVVGPSKDIEWLTKLMESAKVKK